MGVYRSLYIHVPFCAGGKCDYCAFASQGHSSAEERRRYLEKLSQEFQRFAPECQPLRSIFMGGGTPSALSPEELSFLLSEIRRNFTLEADCEWTSEANPDSLTSEKLRAMLSGGVNRLSLGVQSFQKEIRNRIGRRGALENLESIVQEARELGLRRLNLDLIYAVPGETLEQWREDLKRAVALSPDHLSCYSLILEEGTPLAKRLLPEDDDDALFLDCWRHNDEYLAQFGFQRYEISNFAKVGCHCRHNDEIWHGQTYLGCGPAAVSFDGSSRRANPSSLADWLRDVPPEVDELPPQARRREILAFGMRTVAGWNWDDMREVTGFTRDEVLAIPEVQELSRDGLVQWDEEAFRPTAQGLLFNDRILEAIILS